MRKGDAEDTTPTNTKRNRLDVEPGKSVALSAIRVNLKSVTLIVIVLPIFQIRMAMKSQPQLALQ